VPLLLKKGGEKKDPPLKKKIRLYFLKEIQTSLP